LFVSSPEFSPYITIQGITIGGNNMAEPAKKADRNVARPIKKADNHMAKHVKKAANKSQNQAVRRSRRVSPKETSKSHRQTSRSVSAAAYADGVTPVATIAQGQDITERKKAVDVLLENAGLIKAFFESPGVMRGIVEIVDDRTIRHIEDNQVTAGFIGVAPEAVRNKTSSDLGEPPDVVRLWISHYLESMKTGQPVNFEYRDQRGDHTVWLSATVSYLGAGASGNPQFAYVVFDITARKAAEQQALHQKMVQQGINRILQSYLSADTDEELRLISLEVAQNLTGSQFGYIGEVGTDGLLHDTVMSNTGLQLCAMQDKTGHRRLPGRFSIHGLHGRVITDGKSLLTNAPFSHPDSIGTPPGHPEIQAFLGVPLVHAGRTIGIIALANKDGGYSDLDRETVESLAPAVVETIMRRKAEEETRHLAISAQQERDKLSALIFSIPDEVWFADTYKNFTLANPTAVHEFGIRSTGKINVEAFARSLEVYRPDGTPRPVEEAPPLRALRGETILNAEEVVRTPATGELRYRRVSAGPVKDSAGQIVGSVSVARDVTADRQLEASLRETRDYLDNLINYANAPIIVWNTDFEITRFNHAFEHLTGLAAGEVIGQKLDILFPGVSRDYAMAQIRSAIRERWEVVEIPILRKDGSVRTVLWNSATIFAPDGKTLVATIAQGQDITERKKAEESLRETTNYLENLLDYANAPIIVWNSKFEITRFNHAFERLTGRAADEVTGQKLDILFPDDNRASIMELIRKTSIGERWEVVEIPILHRNGSVHITLWNSATIFAPDGQTPVATIAQGQDITARKEAEEKLKQQKADLETANKELEAFSYSVSHDLRAPLRGINGFSQALFEDYYDKLDDKGKEYIHNLRLSTQLMGQLIDDLLKLSRINRAELSLERVNLSEVVESVAADLRQSQPDRPAEFVIAPDVVITGDLNLLNIMLKNLLENAWKFTAKSPQTRIEFGRLDGKGPVFFVKDNGVGFDMQYKNKLFIPFSRLHFESEYPGTGIGLATVDRIVRRHGGRIWAEGAVGQGATFYFTLGQ
jgi:PAS domain S-box-containing protein